MNSMTGYGRGEASNGDVTVLVEIKSVNNRFRDINVRVPRDYGVLEARVVKAIKEALTRGRVDIFIRRSAIEGGPTVRADAILAERYFLAMQDVAKRLARTEDDIPLSAVLSQPGVLNSVEDQTDAASEWDLLNTALTAALEDLIAMRATEGAQLEADLRAHLDDLQRCWAEVNAATDGLTARLQAKLQERINRLVDDRIDEGRLAQEAAILADKADVSEELTRILSHCKQFSAALGTTEPVGRKLDFLTQELNREINTIGSKAAEHPVSSSVVEMKSVLERIREQAANVE
jgi:uncharacterized protein (TIGR00255 family)